jgi:glutathione peroxidase
MVQAQETRGAKKTSIYQFQVTTIDGQKIELSKYKGKVLLILTSKEANPKQAGEVKWNFEKFIIARDGTIVARFLSDTEPEAQDLLDLLGKELSKK